jgi:hypothetical protein
LDEWGRKKQQAFDRFVHFLQKYKGNLVLVRLTLVFIIQKLLELYFCYDFFNRDILKFYKGSSIMQIFIALAFSLTA